MSSFSILPIVSMFFYVAPLVLIIYAVVKFFKLHQEKKQILKEIAKKLDNLSTKNQ